MLQVILIFRWRKCHFFSKVFICAEDPHWGCIARVFLWRLQPAHLESTMEIGHVQNTQGWAKSREDSSIPKRIGFLQSLEQGHFAISQVSWIFTKQLQKCEVTCFPSDLICCTELQPHQFRENRGNTSWCYHDLKQTCIETQKCIILKHIQDDNRWLKRPTSRNPILGLPKV